MTIEISVDLTVFKQEKETVNVTVILPLYRKIHYDHWRYYERIDMVRGTLRKTQLAVHTDGKFGLKVDNSYMWRDHSDIHSFLGMGEYHRLSSEDWFSIYRHFLTYALNLHEAKLEE